MYDFDIIIIGAWAGWLSAAIQWAKRKKKILLIEKNIIWWDSLYGGCFPSKSLIHFSRLHRLWQESNPFQKMLIARESLLRDFSPQRLQTLWIKLAYGDAKFVDNHTINVSEQTFSAAHVIISSGAKPNKISIAWEALWQVITSSDIFVQHDLPQSIVILWWWYIGCELAEYLANMGVKVSLVQKYDKLINRELPHASDAIREHLESLGVNVYVSATISALNGTKATLSTEDWMKNIDADKILLALGRRANIDNMDLHKAWVACDNSWIIIDDYLRTSQKNIYAIGDCVSWNPQFSHLADYQGNYVVQNIERFFKKKFSLKLLPSVLYTSLELASIWMSYEDLYKNYKANDVEVVTLSFNTNDRSIMAQEKLWFVSLYFLHKGAKVLGWTIVSPYAGEMLSYLTLALQQWLGAHDLKDFVHAYPTRIHLIQKVAQEYIDRYSS